MYKYANNPSVVRTGKWILATSFAVLFAFACLGAAELLPNQSNYVPRVTRVGKYVDADGLLPRILLEIPISPHHFDGSVPYTFDALVDVSGELANNWTLENAEAYIIDPTGHESPLPKPSRRRGDGEYAVQVYRAFNDRATYPLRLRFRLTDKVTKDYDQAVREGTMTDEKSSMYIDQFNKMRDAATRGDINTRVSVSVSK